VSPRANADERQVTEYYFIRRGHYRVADLYDPHKDGWYWYTYGVNLRAYAAYISGILINVVGFAGASAY
jgi:nucleobase:cation symporter-1, NCS1 family